MLCGIVIGIGFDIFRVLRKSFRTSDMVTYIEDILFGILTGIFLIIMLFIFNNGQLRFFIFVAISLGLLLYLLTISKYFIKINVIILAFIKKLVHMMLYPIQKLYKIMTKPFYFLIINLKKLHIRKSKKLSNK
jgi:spore cortex biosynthesis protein yabQ